MKLLYNAGYKELLIKQLKEQIMFFLSNNIEFSVVIHMDKGVDFQPPLPDEIVSSFKDYTIFAIGGYTFKSAFIKDDTFIFEAGFGPENIGSVVYVDIDRILQLAIGDSPIFINLVASIEKQEPKDSMSVFSSKSKNQKFFKK